VSVGGGGANVRSRHPTRPGNGGNDASSRLISQLRRGADRDRFHFVRRADTGLGVGGGVGQEKPSRLLASSQLS